MFCSDNIDVIFFRSILNFNGSGGIINSLCFSFISIFWGSFITLSKRTNWPNESPSSWISWIFSTTSSLIDSWGYNSIFLCFGSSLGISLRFTSISIRLSLHSFLFSNNSGSSWNMRFKSSSVGVWVSPSISFNLSPVRSIVSCNPLSMSNIVFNIFHMILGSSCGVLIESLFFLCSHSSFMGGCSFFLTFVLFSDNTGSCAHMFLEASSIWIWSNCCWCIISLSKTVMMMMSMGIS